MIILAPIAAMLIQLAVSRSREFAADEAERASAGIRSDWPTHCANLKPGRCKLRWKMPGRRRLTCLSLIHFPAEALPNYSRRIRLRSTHRAAGTNRSGGALSMLLQLTDEPCFADHCSLKTDRRSSM